MESQALRYAVMRSKAWLAALLALTCLAAMPGAQAQELVRGNYYWYVPEHEKYSQTIFYGEPRFDTRQVRVKSTQRFRLVDGRKGGWFVIQFDLAGTVFVHQRLLRGLVYDPAAPDSWAEFERASVFAEDPKRIQARLQAVRSNPQAGTQNESKVPSWKRYKDNWGLKSGRTATVLSAPGDDAGAAGGVTVDAAPSRSYERKPKNKYPLLPPIGSQPPEAPPAAEGGDPAIVTP